MDISSTPSSPFTLARSKHRHPSGKVELSSSSSTISSCDSRPVAPLKFDGSLLSPHSMAKRSSRVRRRRGLGCGGVLSTLITTSTVKCCWRPNQMARPEIHGTQKMQHPPTSSSTCRSKTELRDSLECRLIVRPTFALACRRRPYAKVVNGDRMQKLLLDYSRS
ncbi:hypothetical protein C8R43DRAFT_94670 [Mycena crocata]|nr:hypothetical protein C8R43DRAFT_94670 [Mycena crocata]